MASGKQLLRSETSSLVKKLLDNPQLPAYIPALHGQQLKQLVKHIGKEDAQEILVYATADQISDLVESDAWSAKAPGGEEKFVPEKFLEWVELWHEMGIAYLSKRLRELGSQIFSLTLERYAVVVDIQEVGVSGSMEVFGDFGVMPKQDENWDLVLGFIADVWDHDSPFLEEVLAYCCLRRSLTVEKTHVTANENLAPDVEIARDSKRRERGYVTSQSAAAFLDRIRTATLDELIVEASYDPFTALQLRRLQPQATAPAASMPSDSGTDRVDTHADDQRELDTLLQELWQDQPEKQLLLTDASRPGEPLRLDQELRRLSREQSGLAAQRMTEITLLANVLMEGVALQGSAMNERQAMQCVHHTCNLGLSHCLDEMPWLHESEIIEEFLQHEPGLIKAFNIGYRLLQELRPRVYAALEVVLLGDRMQQQLRRDPWLRKLILEKLTSLDISGERPHLQIHRLDELLENLSVLCDTSCCEQLKTVGDALPRLPNSLKHRNHAIRVDTSASFIARPDELRGLLAWLEDLERYLWGR